VGKKSLVKKLPRFLFLGGKSYQLGIERIVFWRQDSKGKYYDISFYLPEKSKFLD
jgi:hypothetical protein